MSRKKRLTVKEMKFKNDPMIRLYDKTQQWLQEKGRPVMIAVGVACVAVLLYTAVYYYMSYRESNAETAFAQAFEIYNAPALGPTTTTAPTGKTYTDEKTKWQETAEAFEQLASKYSSYYGVIGRYYAGVAYLHLERDKGIQILREVADKNKQPTSDLARLALAESYNADGDAETAIKFYEQLLNSAFLPKQIVQLGLGHAYEKTGDTQKATEAYFEAAKEDRSTPAGAEAEGRLAALAPERVKELPAPNSQAS